MNQAVLGMERLIAASMKGLTLPETQRSITDLYSVLPDNDQREISAEDVRDIVETLRAGHAELYVSTPAPTTLSNQDEFVKAAGTTTLSSFDHNWTMSQDNRLLYGGTVDRVVHLACTMSMTMTLGHKIFKARIAKNGTTIEASEIQRFVSTGGDIGSTALHSFFDVSPGDYVEVWIACGTFPVTNATVEAMNLFVMDMPK
jgi:hypothetical protein